MREGEPPLGVVHRFPKGRVTWMWQEISESSNRRIVHFISWLSDLMLELRNRIIFMVLLPPRLTHSQGANMHRKPELGAGDQPCRCFGPSSPGGKPRKRERPSACLVGRRATQPRGGGAGSGCCCCWANILERERGGLRFACLAEGGKSTPHSTEGHRRVKLPGKARGRGTRKLWVGGVGGDAVPWGRERRRAGEAPADCAAASGSALLSPPASAASSARRCPSRSRIPPHLLMNLPRFPLLACLPACFSLSSPFPFFHMPLAVFFRFPPQLSGCFPTKLHSRKVGGSRQPCLPFVTSIYPRFLPLYLCVVKKKKKSGGVRWNTSTPLL